MQPESVAAWGVFAVTYNTSGKKKLRLKIGHNGYCYSTPQMMMIIIIKVKVTL